MRVGTGSEDGAAAAGRPRRRWPIRWLLRLALLGAALVVAAGLVEAAMRLTGFDAVGSGVGPQGLFVADEDLGVRLAPDFEGTHRGEEFAVRVVTGPHGLRDTHPHPEEAPVLSLGDSFAYGFGVEGDETWAAVAERELTAARGHPVPVVNAGAPSYGQRHMAALFDDLSRTFRPEVVLFTFFFANDLEDNLRPLDTVRHGYVCSPGMADVVDGNPRLGFILEHSRLLTWLQLELFAWQARRAARAQQIAETGRAAPPPPPPAPGYPYNIQLLESTPPPRLEERWEAAARQITALGRAIRARGAQPLLLRIPLAYQVDEEHWERALSEHGIDGSDLDREADLERLAAICAAAGVELVDLAPSLSAGGGRELYFPVNQHFNADGHRVVGEALAERLAHRLD